MTDPHKERSMKELRKLIESIRGGQRSDDLTEDNVRGYWRCFIENLPITDREKATVDARKTRAALRELRKDGLHSGATR